LEISASGLRSQRIIQNAISSNLANAENDAHDKGGPYRRQFVVLEADSDLRDVRLLNKQPALEAAADRCRATCRYRRGISPVTNGFFGLITAYGWLNREDDRPPRMVYDPSHS